MTNNIINVEHLHWVASNKRSKLCHHLWQTTEELKKKMTTFPTTLPRMHIKCTQQGHNKWVLVFFLNELFRMSSWHQYKYTWTLRRKKNQSLSHHGHRTTKKPVESNNFSDHKSPIVTLTYPTGGFWSIFFTKLSGYLNDT